MKKYWNGTGHGSLLRRQAPGDITDHLHQDSNNECREIPCAMPEGEERMCQKGDGEQDRADEAEDE